MARGVLFGRSLANGTDGAQVVRIAILVEEQLTTLNPIAQVPADAPGMIATGIGEAVRLSPLATAAKQSPG